MINYDTIAAISTPSGVGGIGVIRLSGGGCFGIAQRIFRSNSGKQLAQMSGYTSTLGRVFDDSGDIDDAIVSVYRAPKSYTGEDLVEISCHGGMWITNKVLELCVLNGATPAQSGEFTKRAFLNGKLTLEQSEAVMQLISADGRAGVRVAIAGKDGRVYTEIQDIVEKLTGMSAHIAAWCDYPDEDIEEVEQTTLALLIKNQLVRIEKCLATYSQGRMLSHGAVATIVGKPNVGKSTLMNLLLSQQRSIVTEIAGTTRDIVEETAVVGSCVLRLSDTAGIHQTQDIVEGIGIEKAKQKIASADLVLAVFDCSKPLDEKDFEIIQLVRDTNCIAVLNKCDMLAFDMAAVCDALPCYVNLSATTGIGKELLEQLVAQKLALDNVDYTAPIISNLRQKACLEQAAQSLRDGVFALESGVTFDAVNVCIDFALDCLLSLTGERASVKVIDEVFSKFCVGK